MTQEEELEIILRVRAGDTDAFEALVLDLPETSVYSLALRTVGNEEDARRHGAGGVPARLPAPSGTFRGESKFSVWLYRLTTNVCIDFLRGRAKRRTVSLSWEDEDGEEGELEIPDERFSPEARLERTELRESVRRGLDSLSPEYREILLLREINGLSYDEISRALSLEEGTVKSRIFRARKKLSEFLIREGNIPGSITLRNERKGGANA